MEDYRQRVIAEKADLDGKIERLHLFLGGRTFAGLDPAEQERLMRQAGLMVEYSTVLGERIGAWQAE